MKTESDSRLFISLLGISFGLLLFFAFMLTYISNISYVLLIIVGIIVFLGLITIAGLSFTLKRAKPILKFEKPIIWMLNRLYPIVLSIGGIMQIDKDRIRASFIFLHNRLTRLKHIKAKPEEVLLLLPHCIQDADCKFKVTTDVENCHRCGGCLINNLLELKDKYGFKMEVATGGTIARRKIEDFNPRVVIAVACERDLASGISDVENINVLGITNKRPFGPCYNTTVDLNEIENVLKHVL
ncbi:MAG: DUF116 domain-containing protein [Firmicutes bacterium]|nr:DUF116 domain-containing protein [Bacillota bacterium]